MTFPAFTFRLSRYEGSGTSCMMEAFLIVSLSVTTVARSVERMTLALRPLATFHPYEQGGRATVERRSRRVDVCEIVLSGFLNLSMNSKREESFAGRLKNEKNQ